MASRRRNAPPTPDLPLPRRSFSAHSQRSSVALSQAESDDSSPVPFYNTTFSAHRVSPLHLGKEPLTARRLQLIAQRLRDTLVGDVVRGVEVGLGPDGEDPVMGRAGALETVELRWVRMTSLLDLGRAREGSADLSSDSSHQTTTTTRRREKGWKRTVTTTLARKNALHIALRYETAECTALLIPSLGPDNDKEEGDAAFFVGTAQPTAATTTAQKEGEGKTTGKFLYMPLLLLRMPSPLKTVIADFLATTFDCRVSPLRLGTRSIVRAWEGWITSAGLPTRGPLAKDVVLTLGFYLPPGERADGQADGDEEEEGGVDHQLGLKSVEVFIPVEELRRFVDVGEGEIQTRNKGKRKSGMAAEWEDDLQKRRKLAGRLYEEGWEWRGQSDSSSDPDRESGEQPFTEALGHYIQQHLGMNLFHPGVRITRIACGGFVISEGRIKIFAPADLGELSEGDAASSPGQRGAVWELLRDMVQKARG